MKKIAFVSGIITLILIGLLLTGVTAAEDAANRAIRQGNLRYDLAEYDKALDAYEAGIATNPENDALNFNAAQSAYISGEYQKALEYYEKSADSIEKYINPGNICFKAGESSTDDSEKMQLYAAALQFYYDGIIKFPQDLPLKYNYETVKKIIDDIMQNQEDQNQEEQDNQEQDNQEEEENQEQDSQEQDSQEQQNQEEQDSQEQESQDSQEQDSQDQDESESEQSQSQEEQAQNAEQNDDSEGDNSEAQEQESGDDEQGAYQANDSEGEDEPDREAIERVLIALEMQEENSLKNNQEIMKGKRDTYGW